MAYQKKTIRRLPPQAKKLALVINEVEKQLRSMKRLLLEVELIERDSNALKRSHNGHNGNVKVKNGRVYYNWPRCPEHDVDMIVTDIDRLVCLECPEESTATAAL